MNLGGPFRKSSIRVKLTLVIVLNGSFALLLAGFLLLGYEKFALRRAAASELSIQAAVVADSSTAPLIFNDERAAKETLAALRRNPDLIEAAIYDRDSHLFAWYRRASSEPSGSSDSLSRRPPAQPRQTGAYFENGNLFVSQPIVLRELHIGVVVLTRSMNEVDSRLRRYAGMVGVVLLASLVLALLFSSRMQRTITGPLAQLSSVARHVSVEKDYSVRATRGASDEVGFLIDSFNEMLAQIQIRDEARRGAEESLRESEERFALAARGANDGLWDWKPSTGLMYLSPRGNQMLGYPENAKLWTFRDWEQLVHPGDKDRIRAEWYAIDRGDKEDLVTEYRMQRTDGTYIWVLARGKAVSNKSGIVVRVAGSLTDITAGKVADPLTGLPNRLHFIDRLEAAIEATRDSGAPFAVLFLDLDRFKLVNDSLGHAAGDEFLVEVAGRLKSSVESFAQEDPARGPFIVARLGGDEFAILQHAVHSHADAVRLAERILERLSRPIHICNRQMFASVSIGIAPGSSGDTPEDLLRNADTAMYHAKTGGRARFEVFDERMRERAIERLEIETELRRAIAARQLVVYYQPQVSIPDCRITGWEALVRWEHPVRGLIGPGEFIPIAEETDLILPLGRWVLTEACTQMAEWQREFKFDPPLTISVNVSFKQLKGADFVEEVKHVLDETGLSPQSLRLEMTETTVMANAEATINALQRLKGLNIGLEIDDFGTGYSSLSYLSRLPFDTVKIDCSFVSKLGIEGESSEIVRAIVELARSMSMNVVAEGVETIDQLDALRVLGCSHAQGYLFSRPVNARAAAYVFEAEAFQRSLGKIDSSVDPGERQYSLLPRHGSENTILLRRS